MHENIWTGKRTYEAGEKKMLRSADTNRVMLSTTEAAKLTGFSSTYIQRLLRQKRIQGMRVGPVWLVYEDSLKAFIAQPRKRGPKGPRKHRHVDTASRSTQLEEPYSSEYKQEGE